MINYISTRQLKQFLRLNYGDDLNALIENGTIPKPKLSNNKFLFVKEEVCKMLGIEDNPDERFYDSAEVAKKLGIDQRQIQKWTQDKLLPHYTLYIKSNKHHKKYIYRLSELEKTISYVIEQEAKFYTQRHRDQFQSDLIESVLSAHDFLHSALTMKEYAVLCQYYRDGVNLNEIMKNLEHNKGTGTRIIQRSLQKITHKLNESSNTIKALEKELQMEKTKNKELQRFVDKHELLLKKENMIDMNNIIYLSDIETPSLVKNFFILNNIETLNELASYSENDMKKFAQLGAKKISVIKKLLTENGFKFSKKDILN